MRVLLALLVSSPFTLAPAQPANTACSGTGPYTPTCLQNMLAAWPPLGGAQRILSHHIAVPWSAALEGMIRSVGASHKWTPTELGAVLAAAQRSCTPPPPAPSPEQVAAEKLQNKPVEKKQVVGDKPAPRSEPKRTWTNPKDQLTYVWIPPGDFIMGCSPNDNDCDGNEKPPRKIIVDKGFWIGQTEVTQEAYLRVKPNGLSPFNARAPVDHVTWIEARNYCMAVGGRLPLEDEWEYAARGGNPSSRYGPVEAVAWYGKNSGYKAHDVASGGKLPNGFGLYDTLGNVWEWVEDCYDEKHYARRPNPDHVTKASETFACKRVLRGGSWNLIAGLLRASVRYRGVAGADDEDVGFRCAGDFPAP